MSAIKTKFDNCFVAYIDLLGFKNKVLSNPSNQETLSILIDSLKICASFPSGGKKASSGDGGYRTIDVQSRFFSDTVVLFMKESPGNLSHLLFMIRHLQDKLWENKLCMRGAITIGEMYWPKPKEKGITLGKALIEVYDLESNVAIYPRIILSEGIYQYIIHNNIIAEPFAENGDLHEYISTDEAGIHYLNLLHHEIKRRNGEELVKYKYGFSVNWNDTESSNISNIIGLVEQTINNNIECPDYKVKIKYQWLKKYLDKISQHDRHDTQSRPQNYHSSSE